MNDDPRLEETLREILRVSAPSDPTPGWKREILGRALTPARIAGPPRALLAVWAVAWALIAWLSWSPATSVEPQLSASTPAEPVPWRFAQRAELLKQIELP